MPEQKKTAPRTRYDASIIGDTGLRQYGGYISEEFLKELRGERGMRVYREMSENDPIVGAIVFAITMLIRQAEWTVQAVDDSPEAEAAKEFVEEVLGDMSRPFGSVVDEVCTMFVYGFAPMEIVWKRRGGMDTGDPSSRSRYDDGKIGIRKIELRAQTSLSRWEIDPEDQSIVGMWQQPLAKAQVFIPIEKMLLFRTTENRNNPEGRSALRTAYRPWYLKKRMEEIEGIGVERDLTGLPVAYIPGHLFAADATPEDKAVYAAWKRLVTQVRRDQSEGIILPSQRDASGNMLFDFKLLSTGGSRQFDTSRIVERYDRAIATSVLADFIFLGQQAVGSFALSSDKTALFATAVGAFSRSIAETLNRHLMTRLWELNGMDYEVMPLLTVSDLERPDLTQLGEFIAKLTGAGAQMFPDRDLENRLRDLASLPPAPEDGEMLDEVPPPEVDAKAKGEKEKAAEGEEE
jgi:hypothetical protein